MARKRFTEYKMMNPVVNDWSNGAMAQEAGTGLNSHEFSVSYSGVKLRNGQVGTDPQGFATFHYDNTPSPNRSGGDSIFGLIAGATSTVSLLAEGNIIGAAISAAGVYDKVKSGRATRGAKEEIIGLGKDAIKGGFNNLGATSKPGVLFPQNIRKKSESIVVKEKAIDQVQNNKPRKFFEKNDEIVLTPAQVVTYIALDNVAKTKVAKYISFQSDRSLDTNDVETEWAKLTDADKQTYLDGAADKAKKLSVEGVINYSVDKNTYNKIIETQ